VGSTTNSAISARNNQIMQEDDPYAEEMLEKSLYIVENIANHIDNFTDDEVADVMMMQESMDFYLKNDNMDKAIIECRNLYNKIQQIIN
jgi:DNA-binding SARP family transcriptional activator